MSSTALWLIFLIPVFSFLIISFILRPFFSSRPKLAGYLTILAVAASLGLSLAALAAVINSPERSLAIPKVEWLVIGDLNIQLGLLVDSLTAIMLVVVTGVSLMVQIYSQGYMKGDPGYHRYYAFMSLFTASMLGLVLADNLLMMYVFWEGVGLCSYLLIGFWFHRPSAAAAAKKAFMVTRLGDVGFLLAILYLYFNVHTFDIMQLHQLAITGVLTGTVLTWAAIGIFCGAAGKSAQFPLHTWLPDAMEGPTPVSALIHAATMVAAGVYLVARVFPMFEHSETALTVVAVVGAVTAIFAATMGLVMNDIKRVVAYSTISQLGYMMLGLGVGGVAVGMFHLFTHAFFKAQLFLGSGSVNHTTGTFDMRQMGGLRKHMPWTFATFLIAALSLAGIWPLAGFWSKEGILASALEERPALFYLAIVTVFMTAFYIFRVVFMTFAGQYRGGAASDHGTAHGQAHGQEHGHGGLHESPAVMVVPMVLLAVMAIGAGWFNLGGRMVDFLGGHPEEVSFFGLFTHPSALPWISLMVAGLGILLAYAMYGARWISAEAIGRAFSPLYKLFYRKYWMDELYERVIVVRLFMDGIFVLLQKFDTYVVDGAVNGAARATAGTGRAVRRLQTGQVQAYGVSIVLGVLLIVAAFYLFAR